MKSLYVCGDDWIFISNNNIFIINFYIKVLYFLNIIYKIYMYLDIIGDWGLGIGDWGLGIGPIPNPQSPIPNPHCILN